MAEENISQEFRLKDMEEINQNNLTSKKHKKGCTALNHFDRSLIWPSL